MKSTDQDKISRQGSLNHPNVAEYEIYKRIKLLGEGAFGKAYLVEQLVDKTLWVSKYINLK